MGGQGQGVAAAQEGGRLSPATSRPTERYPRVGAVRPHGGGDAPGRRRGSRPCASALAALGAPRRRRGRRAPAVHARDAGRAAVLRAGLALRDQVRRRPRAGRAATATRSRSTGAAGRTITRPLPGGRDRARARCRSTRFVLDGEIVALDESGRPSFQRLQPRMHLTAPRDVERARGAVPVSAVFFDALALDGHDLRKLPLAERKALLALTRAAARRRPLRRPRRRARRGVLRGGGASSGSRASSPRRAESRYTGGRTRDWIKIKCQRRQEFVIGGWTDPQGSRGWFGALHVGVYEGDRLVYVVQGRHRVRRGDAAPGVGSAAAARAADVAVRRRHADGPRPSLGRADARLPRCASRSGRRTAAFAIRRSSDCAPTRRPKECRRELPPRGVRRTRTTLPRAPHDSDAPPPRARRQRRRRQRGRRSTSGRHQSDEGVLAGRGVHEGRI